MPIRGRPLKRFSTNEESLEVQAPAGVHETSFRLSSSFSHAPYTTFSVTAVFGDRKETGFSVIANIVDRKSTRFGVKAVLVDIDGPTKTVPGFSVKASFGGDTGYRKPPRVLQPRSLAVAPLLSPHREIIPSAD